MTAYKQSTEINHAVAAQPLGDEEPEAEPQSQDDRAAQFARIVSSRWPAVKFVGVWDTVASVIVPRPDKFYTFSLQEVPYTRRNPSVRVFRQAIALDERRRMFRCIGLGDAQIFMPNRFSKTNNSDPQESSRSGLQVSTPTSVVAIRKLKVVSPNFRYLWMISEAAAHGLAVNSRPAISWRGESGGGAVRSLTSRPTSCAILINQ